MTLDQYLTQEDDTGAALAERCKTTEASISRIRNGLQTPSPKLAKRIEIETGGKVLASLLLGLEDA